MAILYLTEQRAWVGREGECLVIHVPQEVAPAEGGRGAKREIKKSVPLSKIEEVMITGDITISTPALTTLLEAGVNIVYLNRYGNYLGTLSPHLTKNSLLRLAQHEFHADPARRHRLARYFVVGKLRNMRTVLMRYHRLYPDSAVEAGIASLKSCIESATTVELQTSGRVAEGDASLNPELEEGEVAAGRMNGLGPLLGYEGAGSAAYFGVFARLIKCDWPHGFTRRVRRPPTDPVNALLSYGYTILASQINALITGVGFDPYIGWLHSSRYGKPALALDLLEEFRPVVVDSVVLTLLNNRQLNGAGFKAELNAYRMSDPTRQLFLQKFEERMQEVIVHPFFGYKATYRRCIELQARLLSKYLLGEVSDYVPFAVR